MCTAAVESLDALLLVHTEGSTQQVAIGVVLDVQITYGTVQELAHITTEIHLAAVLQAGNGGSLQVLDVQIQIQPVVTIIEVAVIVNLIYLVVGTTGVVHQHHIVGIQILAAAAHLLVELLRGVGLGF